MDKEIEYYKGLGLEVLSDHVEKVRIVKFDNGIELLQYESQSETNLRKAGISHVAFTHDPDGNSLEVVYGRLVK